MVLTGRGGFGNYSPRLAPKDSPKLEAVDAPPPVQRYTDPNQPVRTGRGGAGNLVPISQIPTLSKDEYLADLQKSMDAQPKTVSVGRGGSGNIKELNPNGTEKV